MTTCPQCGRVADDEFVCAGCGAFLAAEPEEGAAGDVPVGRLALLVILVCLLAVGAAAVLLRQGGGSRNTDLGAPPTVPLSSAPLGPLTTPLDDSSDPVTTPTSHPLTTSSTAATSSSASTSSSARASRTASPSTTAPTTSAAPHPSTSRAPSTSASSHSSSPRPSTSSAPSPPPAAPTVQLAKGASCGPHCYSLVVSLRNFSAGSHTVTCFSDRGQYGSFSTSATTSTGCSYSHPHDTVWVVVEGHRSNTVSW